MNTLSLSRSELKTLLGKGTGACASVSIFMPTQKPGTGVQQNAAQFENLLYQAEGHLRARGLRQREIAEMMAPARQLVEDSLFWKQQSDGLAVFVAKEIFRSYSVPLHFAELVIVADRFHIKPFLPLFTGDKKFYVLALSQNKVRLLQGSQTEVTELDLTGIVPTSLAEALKYDESGQVNLSHTGQTGIGKKGTVFHGKDIGDVAKTRIMHYFRQVDRGLQQKLLGGEKAPLVLAGVGYLHPIYKKTNTYQGLYDKGITGNPERLSPYELQSRALDLLQPLFDRAREEAMSEYRQLLGKGHTSTDVQEIVAAAHAGSIEALFVAADRQQWGTFDPDTAAVDLHEDAQPCDDDLVDIAAGHTIIHRGKVFVIKPEEVPDGSLMAAVFRHEKHAPQFAHAGRKADWP